MKNNEIIENNEEMENNDIICTECGCVCEDGDYITTEDGDELCCECSERMGYIKCRECGEFVKEEDACYDEHNNDYVCQGCYDNDSCITCEDCGEITNDYEIINYGTNHEKHVCDRCAGDYYQCADCGRYYSYAYITYDTNLIICDSCSGNWTQCHSCDDVIQNDDANYDDETEEYYCNNCYDNIERSSIRNHGYKPDPEFLGNPIDNLYMGVELEVDDGDEPNRIAKRLTDMTDDIYCKHDGSLNHGFEIVSHPASLDYHMDDLGWDKIADICKENGFKSHETNTCGLHVHVSRKFFGQNEVTQDLNIAKLILLINRFWDTNVVKFSRRNVNKLYEWARKNELSYDTYDNEYTMCDKVKYCKGNRYQAINLENRNTIEFRIFKGTLNISTLKATLQFVDTICRYAKKINLKMISSTKWEDIFEDTSYEELNNYMENMKLIEREVSVCV
jgi:hypothetical protein